jgi:hypothetical protein
MGKIVQLGFIGRSVSSSSDEDSELENDMGFEGDFSPTRSKINNERFDTTTSQIIMNGKGKSI